MYIMGKHSHIKTVSIVGLFVMDQMHLGNNVNTGLNLVKKKTNQESNPAPI